MDLTVLPVTTKDRLTLDVGQVIEKIAVQRPYFAFDVLYQTSDPDWAIWGDFKPEQPLGSESGPLTFSEITRHLATLGACAATSQQNPNERMYHLVAHAVWALHKPLLSTDRAATFTARARATDLPRKHMEAQIELLSGGQVMGDLTVSYQALSERVFDLAFVDNCSLSSPSPARSPYRRLFPLIVLSLKRHEITACSVDFSAERCVGHFPDYPMWPVSGVISGMCEVMAQLLAHEFQRTVEYTVMHAEVQAVRLVAASEQLLFSATLMSVSCEGRVYSMSCCATHDNEVVALLDAVVAIRRD